MNEFRLILLVADPSLRRTAAFDRARRLALTTRSPLHLQLLVRSRTIDLAGLLCRKGAEQARTAYIEDRRRWLHDEVDALRAAGIEASGAIQWSAIPEHDMGAIMFRLQPDLVIKDAEPDVALCGLGPALQRYLLRKCAAPFLLVRGESSGGPGKIGVALNTRDTGGEAAAFNEAIFNAASALAACENSELHLIQADAAGGPAPSDSLTRFAWMRRIPLERCHHFAGGTAGALVDFTVGNGIDLLVLGRSNRSSRSRLWGTVAERINRLASCDVLTVNQAPRIQLRSSEPSPAPERGTTGIVGT